MGSSGRIRVLRDQLATWELVRDYLNDQISIGRYPTGSWLPSVRKLATELEINRNTVSKVYQALRREGVLEPVRGRGVRVIQATTRTGTGEAEVASEIQQLVRKAHARGMDRDWLVGQVASIARDTYGLLSVRVGFVECTEHEARVLTRDLSQHLSTDVEPVVLGDLVAHPRRYADTYDILATTFFHLQEVTRATAGHSTEVVGMNHTPSHQTMLQVAGLEPDITIAVVCQNERTLELILRTVAIYARGTILGATLADSETLKAALRDADVVVVDSLSHDEVVKRKPGTRAITTDFQIERQSIEYLRQSVVRHRDLVGAAV